MLHLVKDQGPMALAQTRHQPEYWRLKVDQDRLAIVS